MFDNKDYCKVSRSLMIAAIVGGYLAVAEYSRVLGIKWVIYISRWSSRHQSPPLEPNPLILIFAIACLVFAQAITLQRCFNRIEDGEISWQEGIKDWLIALAEYIIAFIVILIFLPLFFHLKRGW